MSRLAEAAVFLGLALAAHLGVWVWVQGSGVTSGGDGGAALVSLEASSPALAGLVRRWQRPPALAQNSPAPMPAPALAKKPALRLPAPTLAPSKPAPIPPLTPASKRQAAPFTPPHIVTATLPTTIPTIPPLFPVSSAMAATTRPPRTPPPAQPPAHILKLAALRPPPMAQPRPDAPPKPSPAGKSTAAIAPERAAGRGQRGASGSGGRADVSTRNAAREGTLMARWGARIRRSVERRKRYPRGSRASGTVLVQLRVTPNGRLVALQIRRSSGNMALDDAALKAVRRARLPRAPKGLGRKGAMFNLPIRFSW